MSLNQHGIYITESKTSMPRPTAATNGVPVVFGTAPVNMADDPEAEVNVPRLCSSYDEAVRHFGWSEDFENYTICSSIYAQFVKQGVGPVIFVNVLDPTKHVKNLEETTVTVSAKQAKIEKEGILKAGLVVKNGESTLKEDTDYTLSFNSTGYLVVNLLASGSAADAKSLTVSGKMLDPTTVDEDTIIGGYDTKTHKRSGIEVLADVYEKTGEVPSVLLAPYWSAKKNVAKILQLKCEGINDVFRATAVIDLDTDACKTYEATKEAKDAAGINDSDAIVLWPLVATKDHDGPVAFSAVYVASMQQCDIDHESVPSKVPSNLPVGYISGAVLKDGTAVSLDRAEANVVEGGGVVTLLRWAGQFRIWGDYTAAYPEETDAKDYWINVRRMFSWQANNFILLYINDVDENISYRQIQSIVDSENIRIASYVPTHLAAGHIEFRAEDNSDASLVAGIVKFKQYLSPYVPMKVIVNDLEYDISSLINAIFGTTEE